MKKFSVIFLIFVLVLLTAFIKNSTKRIDDMIFVYKENIRSLNSDFENIKLKTSNQMLLNITSAKIIKKNNNIKFYSSRINLEGVLGKSYF